MDGVETQIVDVHGRTELLPPDVVSRLQVLTTCTVQDSNGLHGRHFTKLHFLLRTLIPLCGCDVYLQNVTVSPATVIDASKLQVLIVRFRTKFGDHVRCLLDDPNGGGIDDARRDSAEIIRERLEHNYTMYTAPG